MAMNEAGTAFVSSYNSTSWSYKYNPTPEVTKLESTTSGVKITWGAINGAAQYRVFVKNASGSWVGLGNTTGTSYVYADAKKGQTYTFTVRCVSADGKTFTSSYSNTGWSITYK